MASTNSPAITSGSQSPSVSPRPGPPARPDRSSLLFRRSASVASVDEAQRYEPPPPVVESQPPVEQKIERDQQETALVEELGDYDPAVECEEHDYGVEYELDELTGEYEEHNDPNPEE